ncbi:hypothetical protein A2U01_0058474, partial [Trifolium medium]|nr:hypothetical protein [Trifolium medium]
GAMSGGGPQHHLVQIWFCDRFAVSFCGGPFYGHLLADLVCLGLDPLCVALVSS